MLIPTLPLANYGQVLAAQAVLRAVKPYAPLQADSGRETWFEGAGAFVCAEGRSWSQVWDRHIKNESFGNQRIGNLNPAPSVDFDKNVVVALFSGPTRGVVGYRFQRGFVLGNEAFLRLVPVASGSSADNFAVPSPWVFLVLPRTKASLNIQIPGGGAWTTVAKVKPTL